MVLDCFTRPWQTRTHCCGHSVAHDVSWAAQTGTHLLRTQNVSEQNQKNVLCPVNKICVRNKTGKHLYRQQCVGNNVSSFARALMYTCIPYCIVSVLIKSISYKLKSISYHLEGQDKTCTSLYRSLRGIYLCHLAFSTFQVFPSPKWQNLTAEMAEQGSELRPVKETKTNNEKEGETVKPNLQDQRPLLQPLI